MEKLQNPKSVRPSRTCRYWQFPFW